MLHGVGHPIQQVLEVRLDPGADVVFQVCQVEGAVSPNGRAAEADPEVELAIRGRRVGAGSVDDAIVLSTLLMIDPPATNADLPLLAFLINNNFPAFVMKSTEVAD